MKKLLAGLFALMALGLVLSGCKKDDDDDDNEEVFTELAESDFDNTEEWFIGSWYGEIEEFDFDCSDSFAESQSKTKNELKNAFKEMLQELDIIGDMEITEDNSKDYNKTIAELFSSGTAKEYVNEDKTKLRIIMDVNESQDDDMWVKYKANILCTKK